jgi:hypothetical protein
LEHTRVWLRLLQPMRVKIAVPCASRAASIVPVVRANDGETPTHEVSERHRVDEPKGLSAESIKFELSAHNARGVV